MGICAVSAVFATENVIDILITKYVVFPTEILLWVSIAAISGYVLHEVGEDRGDW